MIEIAIIVGSTRPGRKADAVAAWVHGLAKQRSDAEFEVVDIKLDQLVAWSGAMKTMREAAVRAASPAA